MKNFPEAALLLLVSACSAASYTEPDISVPEDAVDSVDVVLHPMISSMIEAEEPLRTDIFVYSSDNVLESHSRIGCLPEEIHLRHPAGRKSYVLLCNFPFNFNLTALKKYESMEKLSFSFADDSSDAPVLSGYGSGDSLITLTPLLCAVRLESVSNALEGYELLESPSVWLSGMNPACELLRDKDFRPTEEYATVRKTALPYDVGFYTQNPGTVLFCYPNDTPEDILGTVRTVFNFSCSIKGAYRVFSRELPPMTRNTALDVNLTVLSEDECIWEMEIRER